MAQPISSVIGDLLKSSPSIAHSDDFEEHKSIQTNSWQRILLDLNILYWCPASRDQIKPLLVQPQIACNANGFAVANPIGRAMIWDDRRIWGPWLARCASRSWTARKKFVVLSTQRLRVGVSTEQAAEAASSKQAANKQQPAFAP